MNLRMVFRQLGLLLLVLGGCLLLVTGVELAQWESGRLAEPKATIALALSMALSGALGGTLYLLCRPREKNLIDLPGRREALLLVSLSWVVGAAVAAVPYFLWAWLVKAGGGTDPHPFASLARCYFEAMSGLTTTGASVLSNIESLPRGILLWRSLTQWLGGLGIVVLFVAVLPTLGVGGKKLFQAEAPGPTQPGVRPRIRDTARALWMIYLAMTAVLVLLLWLLGMNLFDAVCHTFTTMATGGFSNYTASISAFDSAAIDFVIVLFMLLAGVNFGLYYKLLQRRWKGVYKDPELRLYLGIVLIATLLIGVSIYGTTWTTLDGQTREGTLFQTVRYSLFQTVSIQTTTGYATADYDEWGFLPQAVLVTLMFIGASAGSTGGGIKVIRILVVARVLIAEIEKAFRPSVVRPIKVGKTAVSADMRQALLVYVLTILAIFALGSVVLMMFEPPGTINFTTAATASAATLNNIGPGLSMVGPTDNFAVFSDPSLVVLSLLMVLGRLEVYALLALVLPRFWTAE